ncbi:MAG: FMN-binding glutamate synthase family protein [Burkholderiales bacterium]|nr:FMN-binding glutamate synthase family protein [Burkholderiales bacterium]
MEHAFGMAAYGLGIFVAFVVAAALIFLFVRDVTQKQHTILRNYPIVGHLRYYFEELGEYFRQYFFMGDRDEMPFNRATRSWIYRLAKNEGGVIGFGSTYDLHIPGALIFVNAGFPVLEEERAPTPSLVIGAGYAAQPFTAHSVFNLSGMSFGAISEPAVRALSRGAKEAGCWMDTGEGGLSPFHLEGGCDIIMQIGTAKYGVRDEHGNLSPKRLREIAAHEQVRAFELKLSQGAKPGKGGVLPGAKVTPIIAQVRGIPVGQDSISPNRHRDIATIDELIDSIARIRDITGKPVGIKTAIGGWRFINELCDTINRRGLAVAPDFLVIDGGEGGTGAAPQALADHVGLSIDEALPRVADSLMQAGLKGRIRLVGSGKIVTSARAAWALCAGADFINSARGFMFSLGCIQALRCHQNTCPTGITTHNPRLQRGLVVEEKAVRVANYCKNMNKEIDMIAHSCGLTNAREFTREHVRLVQADGSSRALNMIYPYPEALKRAA